MREISEQCLSLIKKKIAESLAADAEAIENELRIPPFGIISRKDGSLGYVYRGVDNHQPVIKNVIFRAPATIVFWSDGDKTVVKATNELFDREKGLAMAISKKFLGNKGNYFNTFKKYIR